MSIFNWIVIAFQKINLVEIIKVIVIRISKVKNKSDMIKISNLVIDLFIVLKWSFIIIITINSVKSSALTLLVIYLLIMNVHTYFYYHSWSDKAILGVGRSINHIRRKFITLMVAVGYNIISYAYLYNIALSENFIINESLDRFTCSIIHSLSATFTGGSDYITPANNLGLYIQVSQILVAFIFIGIILSKADSLEEKGESSNGL